MIKSNLKYLSCQKHLFYQESMELSLNLVSLNFDYEEINWLPKLFASISILSFPLLKETIGPLETLSWPKRSKYFLSSYKSFLYKYTLENWLISAENNE